MMFKNGRIKDSRMKNIWQIFVNLSSYRPPRDKNASHRVIKIDKKKIQTIRYRYVSNSHR